MQASSALVEPLKTHGKTVSLQKAYQTLNIESSFCSNFIEPINAITIGEFYNDNPNRNAVILIFDPEFRRKCKLVNFDTAVRVCSYQIESDG